ncbi:glycosyltransferase family 2 protein [Lacrimispora sp.]|uniref:glycosyltransferase family 2 protein n=1 Tax=Lacrimispora sp. TaxID=2719234 RepID=UPI002FD906D3
MMEEAFIGIVLVNYNGVKDTIECIDSLKKMTYSNYRIIVVDNNSSDNSLKILHEKKEEIDFELLELNENKGFSAGNNAGIRLAFELGVKYILLLNNDTLVEPDFLKKLMVAEKNILVNSVMTSTILYADNKEKIWYAGGSYDLKTSKVSQWGMGKQWFPMRDKWVEVTFISGCCMCIPVSIIPNIGFLDEDYFLYEEDTDYCIRIRQKGIKLYYVPNAVIYHKVSSSTSKAEKMSGTTQYYMVRNKYFLIKKYYKGRYRIIPYIHSFMMYSYYCLRYGMEMKYIMWGIYDFWRGKMHKTNRKL